MHRGFTLVEVMITMVILGAAMAVALAAVNTASVETSLGTADAVVQDAANALAETLVAELRGASRTSVTYESDGTPTADYGDCIRFRVPVDPDGDGSVINADTGQPEYGATLGMLHTADSDIVYRFVANQVGGVDEMLTESTLAADVNNDGDRFDVFARGHFTRTAPDAGGVNQTRGTGGRWFVVGDGDNDGVEEPIFQQQADGTIVINLLAVQLVGRNRIPARARVTTSVHPLNE
jgi:prepilin-type N-terminal cleavage/methylation domain-containing protein